MFPRRLFPGGGPQKKYAFPDPDPQGIILRPLTKIVSLISATDTFRTRNNLETDDPVADEKLIDGDHGVQRRIFYPEVDWDTFDVFPSAVVQFGPDWRATLRAGGAQNDTRPAGSVRVILMDEDQNPGDIEASMRDFGTYVGQLLDDMRSQFAVDDEFTGIGITQEESPFLPDKESEASRGIAWWTCSYLFEWSS